jgi:ferredoxin--NADP+ reductase
MTYVIAKGCCNDASCIPVCPVDCIRPRPGDPDFMSAEQLYIDPTSCIDCAACVAECPVGAIHDEWDIPAGQEVFKDINAEYFDLLPLEVVSTTRVPKRTLPEDRPTLRVAVVGAGPSGCYAVEELCKVAGVEVSVFDKLPTPYGLVRAGVAPDHQDTKGVTKGFQHVLKRPGVTCYFNVEIGKDLTIDEILQTHHALIFSSGADDDRKLDIPGEDLPGSFSAREFVAWYNGHPDHARSTFDLAGERVVIIGNGNVALDVARVLAAPVESFDPTDMAQYAVDALRDSGVREVVVSARRGPLDAAYTTSEFMSLQAIEGVDVVTLPDEVRLDIDVDPSGHRYGAARRRDLAIAASTAEPSPAARRIVFRYLLTPVSINGSDTVESVTFRRTGSDDELETLEASLVLRAIGYRASPMADVPFDRATGTVPNELGRVLDPETGGQAPGLYCTGWAKRGATGVIGTNKVDSLETVTALFDDFASGVLADPPRLGDDVAELVRSRQPEVLGYAEWIMIDKAELARGKESVVAKARHKFHEVAEMLAAARS